jgi:hypothetical protein
LLPAFVSGFVRFAALAVAFFEAVGLAAAASSGERIATGAGDYCARLDRQPLPNRQLQKKATGRSAKEAIRIPQRALVLAVPRIRVGSAKPGKSKPERRSRPLCRF